MDKENQWYYLLPLDKLVSTTYYAILDNYEKSNFDKCNKYLDRIRYIKLTHDLYSKSDKNNTLLNYIYRQYYEKIYHKYKIIYDYPFLASRILANVKDKDVAKCVKRQIRTEINSTYENKINNYITKCEDDNTKIKFDEITELDTENDLKFNDYKSKYIKYKLKYIQLKKINKNAKI